MNEEYSPERETSAERDFNEVAGRGPSEPSSTQAMSVTTGSLLATSPRPVSGWYEGEMTSPAGGRDLLDLRIDIDQRFPNSQVMNRLSVDLFQVNRLNLPGSPPRAWRVYRESWIVNSPQVVWATNEVQITGTVRYWNGIHPTTAIKVRIPWDASGTMGPADVTFNPQGGTTVTAKTSSSVMGAMVTISTSLESTWCARFTRAQATC
jgi:hypothetical protein